VQLAHYHLNPAFKTIRMASVFFAGARLDDYLLIELGFIDFGSYSTQANNQKVELFSADSVYLTHRTP